MLGGGEGERSDSSWTQDGVPSDDHLKLVPVLHNSETVHKDTTGNRCVAHSGEKKSVSTVVIKLPQIQRCKTIKLYYGAVVEGRHLTTVPQAETRKSASHKTSDT